MDEQPSLPTIALSAEASAGRLAVRAAARTHPGRVRDLNEDSVILISLSGLLAGTAAPSRGPELGFFAVADGMGGHEGGEIASRRVTQQLAAALLDRVIKRLVVTGRGADETWMARVLRDCVLAANAELLTARRANRSDMGTTLTAALVIDGRAPVANLGASPTNIWRAPPQAQITPAQ